MNEFFQTYPGLDVNTIETSPKILKYLEDRKLKPGESVQYRILKKTKNLDPQRKKGDDWLFPSVILFNLRDRIKKPEGGILEIGVVDKFDEKTKMPTFKSFVHNPQKGDGGIIFLNADNIDDIEKYPIMELSNKNGSNPFRDASEDPLYERVDDAKEAKVRSKKRNYLKDSLNAIDLWTNEELRIAAASNFIPTTLDIETIKDKLETIAEQDPKKFYESIDDPINKSRAIITIAKEMNIIQYSAHENKWFLVGSNQTVALLDRREGVEPTEQFTQFMTNSPKGQDVKEQLLKLIKNKKNNS
jgi:hypothetical protein